VWQYLWSLREKGLCGGKFSCSRAGVAQARLRQHACAQSNDNLLQPIKLPEIVFLAVPLAVRDRLFFIPQALASVGPADNEQG
jgi:hypothetical protein